MLCRLAVIVVAVGLGLPPAAAHAQSAPRPATPTSPAPDTLRENALYQEIDAHNARAASHNRMLAAYNEAQQHTQAAVAQLNAFFDYYNHQFKPLKTDAQLRALLPPIAARLQQARTILSTVQFEDEQRQATVRELTGVVTRGETRLRNSQAFLKRYLSTAPAQRPVLFTTRGGPNEMTR